MDKRKLVSKAEEELQRLDPRLGRLIEFQKPIFHEPRTDYFLSLSRSIVGQQVSLAAASAIFARLEQTTKLKPKVVADLSDEQAKIIGLSRQKIVYIRDLARHFAKNSQVYGHLDQLDDQQVIEELTSIKGIGVWTAQMFLMFSLVRLDVFAPDDIGLQRAMKQLYGWQKIPARPELMEIAEHWKPYRSVACWHLWHSLHNTPD